MRISRWSVVIMALSVFGASIVVSGKLARRWTGGAGQGAGAPPQGGGGGGRGGAGGGGGRGGGGGGRGGNAAAAPQQPAPRWPDGKIRLGGGNNGKGLWHGAFGISATDVPYQEWARGVASVRQSEKLEPHARCKPSGAVRQFQTPYGVDIVELPNRR
jgi:hypothetical protein